MNNWWVQNIMSWYVPLEYTYPELEIKLDPHPPDILALCKKIEIDHPWKENNNDLTINRLELILSGKHVKTITHNTCALTYLKNMDGYIFRECNDIANEIQSLCLSHETWLTITPTHTHTPGRLKIIVERKSNIFNYCAGWKLYSMPICTYGSSECLFFSIFPQKTHSHYES